MLKNTLYLILACCLLAGCEDYDWETRMIVEGRVVDQNGNPVSGIVVNTEVDTDPSAGNSSLVEIISYTTTDANGYYRMMFPKPNYNGKINLLINADQYRNAIDAAYSITEISNVRQSNFNDYLVNLGEQDIFLINELTTLTIETNDDPALIGYITAIEVDGLLQQKVIDYNFDVENPDNQFYFTEVYSVAANQSLVVKYTTRTEGFNGPVYTTTEASVQIGTEPVTYAINY
ncbi:MAG: carboxypeptidase-like regulatory domain-containing protein [Flavobacterium sp.]